MTSVRHPEDEEWMRILHTVNGQPLADGEAELDASAQRAQSIMTRFQRGREQQKADGAVLYAAVIGVQDSLGSFGALDGREIPDDFERSQKFADKWRKMATSPEAKSLVEQTVAHFEQRCHSNIPPLFVGDDPQPLEPIGCSARDFVEADIRIRQAEAPSTSVKVLGATLRTVNTLATPFVYAGHAIGESVVWGAKEVGGSVAVLTKAACETDALSTTCAATADFAQESGRTLVDLAKQARQSEALKPACDYIAKSAGQVVRSVKHLEGQGVPVTKTLESVISVAAFVWPAAKLMRANAANGAAETVVVNRAGVGGSWVDYSHDYQAARASFLDPKQFEGVLSNELALFRTHTPGRGKWRFWSPVSIGNRLHTMEELKDSLALLEQFGDKSHMAVAIIPKGASVKFLHGKAAPMKYGAEMRPGGTVQYCFEGFDTKWIKEVRALPDSGATSAIAPKQTIGCAMHEPRLTLKVAKEGANQGLTHTQKILITNVPRLNALRTEAEIIAATQASAKPSMSFIQFMERAEVFDFGRISVGDGFVEGKLLYAMLPDGRAMVFGRDFLRGSPNLIKKIGSYQLVTSSPKLRFMDRITGSVRALESFVKKTGVRGVDYLYDHREFPAMSAIGKNGKLPFALEQTAPFTAYGSENRYTMASLAFGKEGRSLALLQHEATAAVQYQGVLGNKEALFSITEALREKSSWLQFISRSTPPIPNAFGVVNHVKEGLVFSQGRAYLANQKLIFEPSRGKRGFLLASEESVAQMSEKERAALLVKEFDLISARNGDSSYTIFVEGESVLKEVFDPTRIMAEGRLIDKGTILYIFEIHVR